MRLEMNEQEKKEELELQMKIARELNVTIGKALVNLLRSKEGLEKIKF